MIGASLTLSAAASILFCTVAFGTFWCATLDAIKGAALREFGVPLCRRVGLASLCLLVCVQAWPEVLVACGAVGRWPIRAVIEYGLAPALVGGLLVGHFLEPVASTSGRVQPRVG